MELAGVLDEIYFIEGFVLFVLLGVTHWAACGWYEVGDRNAGGTESDWIEKFVPGGRTDSSLGIRYLYSCQHHHTI